MNQITFTNKKHGKINMNIADIEAWKIYMSDDKQPPHEDKIINLHPQPNVEVLKKGRGRPKKIIFQPAIIPEIIPEPEPEPEPIHQHPEPEIKRKVGRPRKIIQVNHHQYLA